MPSATITSKETISTALKAFLAEDLVTSTNQLWETLSYHSDRRLDSHPLDPHMFLADYDPEGKLNQRRALIEDWRQAAFLFQYTSEEARTGIAQAKPLLPGMGPSVDFQDQQSYLFCAISLQGAAYTRTQLASITREINRLFPMPVLVLFRHGASLTLAIIDHRISRRDAAKDVLEKVTLIKDVSCGNPHRAHIDILYDLSCPELHRIHGFRDFATLHQAWRKTLDISELNKRFFQEVANWYFWAIRNVQFPIPRSVTDTDSYNAQSVIRLITRLIFCWFLKEKSLILDDLFNPSRMPDILNGETDFAISSSTRYYKAILQNLFFATLNQEMGDRRQFRRDGQNYNITNLYRYRSQFRDPDQALQLFSQAPFLNGGLFECLDKFPRDGEAVRAKGEETVVRVDGFSDRPDNLLAIPDYLFFGSEREVDLNSDYGTSGKRYRARGLVSILSSYKFTVEENTPIEEEVALDPELLGKVFENLLAAYNPETGTTARKQTGSFYTPREIVDYMVDESLIGYFEAKLLPPSNETSEAARHALEPRLRHLLSYNEAAHGFPDEEVARLVEAIDNIKVLDPACGSGAFPMGVLHKLVFVLRKLDPGNQRWKQKQIDKAAEIPDVVVREQVVSDIEQVFGAGYELDYSRKLYLIENCIYGVDIQPIAVQIAKLRFFISLIVDQKVDDTKPNRGIRPLPNLETKFVAANTLIGIQGPEVRSGKDGTLSAQNAFRSLQIAEVEKRLAEVRRRHFEARTQATKDRYRQEDRRLRAELVELLQNDGWGSAVAAQLATWDPYDQNASSPFFDPEWMFGLRDGFDIVIGNPPYVRVDEIPPIDKAIYRKLYQSCTGKYDLYYLFLENAMSRVQVQGTAAFITPNRYCSTTSGTTLRHLLVSRFRLTTLTSVSNLGVFEDVANYPVISVFLSRGNEPIIIHYEADNLDDLSGSLNQGYRLSGSQCALMPYGTIPINVEQRQMDLLLRLVGTYGRLGDSVNISEGLRIPTRFECPQSKDTYHILKQYQFDKYSTFISGAYVQQSDLATLLRPGTSRHTRIFQDKIVIAEDALNITATLDCSQAIPQGGVYFAVPVSSSVPLECVLGILNSKLLSAVYRFMFGGMHMGGEYLRYRTTFLEALPFPEVQTDTGEEAHIADLIAAVGLILEAKAANPAADVSALEAEVDQFVYHLYDLNPEEIAIVEGETRG
jgi:hypothetical protein